jgi:hypothetical protein
MSLYKLHEAVIWWGTPVEIASALARLLRMKRLEAWNADSPIMLKTLWLACSNYRYTT